MVQTTSQSHSENQIGHSTTNFAELLKPISNLAKVWEIDLTPYINDFFASFLPEEIPDFRTAATLVLGASEIFGKKVDFLYEQLQQVLFNNTKQRRRRTTNHTGNFVLDLDVETKDFDLSDFFESMPVHQADSLCLRPKLPQTSLSQRQINENDDYRISPVYNSILLQGAVVFEEWDQTQLKNALLGRNSDAQPMILSTPIEQRHMDEIERTIDEMRTGHLQAVAVSTFIPNEEQLEEEDTENVSFREQDDLETHTIDGQNEELDCQAFTEISEETLVKQESLTDEISNFALELSAFTERRKRGKPMREEKYRQMDALSAPRIAKSETFVSPCYMLYNEPDQDIQPETLDFEFFEFKNLECHVEANQFFEPKAHTACCVRTIAARLVLAPEEHETELAGNDAQILPDLNFDFEANIQAEGPIENSEPNFGTRNDTETLREELAQRNRQYRKLEIEQFLKWVNFKVDDKKCDINEIEQNIRDKIEDGQKDIRIIGGHGEDLARTFIGSLLMASNGEVDIETGKDGEIIVETVR